MIAAASLSVAAVTLSKRSGVAYINLDSALRDPGVFYAFVVAPIVLAAGAAVALLLPRIVTINIAVTLGLLIVFEAGARLFVPGAPPVRGEPELGGRPGFYVRDEALGYAVARSVTAHHRRSIGETQIYDVSYRTDMHGRRETPANGDRARGSFLLFFGDSNVFGEGLSQTETLPFFAAEAAPGYRVYNYGIPGYGPAQILALAHRRGIRAEVEGAEGYAIFVVIPAHVGRVVGSSRVSTNWGRHFPYYVEAPNGELLKVGDFTHGRPLTTLAYFFWAHSALADRLGVELPIWYSERDYRLTARLLQESRRVLTKQLGLRGSVIVLAQASNAGERRVMAGIRDALVRQGTPYLDYTRLIDSNDPQYRLAEHDYHYSAKANRIVAQQLVADLLHPESPTEPPRGPRAMAAGHDVPVVYENARHRR
jgi:hypothetical protein